MCTARPLPFSSGRNRFVAPRGEAVHLLLSTTPECERRRVPLSEALLEELRTRVGRLVPFEAHYPASFARKIGRMADLKDFHVHRMRHTFATQWIARRGTTCCPPGYPRKRLDHDDHALRQADR
jgi:integrase